MRKLLAANFSRLRKDSFFWCILAAVVIFSFMNALNSARSCSVMAERGFIMTLDDYFFNQAPLMGVFFGLFTSWFLGTEYSDGTIRNKLIIGHKREQIYLSNFTVCTTASLILLAAWMLVSSLGFGLIGPMEMGLSDFASYIAAAVAFTISFGALYTLIGSLSANKAGTIICTFVVFLALAIIASGLYDRLCAPEMNEGVTYVNGQFLMPEPTPNPLYLSGMVRTVCQCTLELLPTGQALLVNDVALEQPIRTFLLSVAFTIGVLTLGCCLFRRKNIR